MVRRGVMTAALLATLGPLAFTSGCAPLTCEEKATCPPPTGAAPSAEGGVTSDDAASAPDDSAVSSGGGPPSPDGSSCAPVENCTNGVDDDCNGLIDCADPACQPRFTCVEAASEGWSGPGILFEGPGDADASSVPACPTSFSVDAVDGMSDPSADPAECGCSCGAPSGVVCDLTASFFFDSQCTSKNLCSSDALTLNACAATCSSPQTMMFSAPVAQGGACASQPTTHVPAPSWGSIARVCGSPLPIDAPGGCGAGQACVPNPPSPFEAKTCIWQSGAVACPDSGDARSVYFASASDTRACSSCTCGPPEDACDDVAVTTFSDSCTTSLGTVAAGGGCLAAPAGAHFVEETLTASAGSCTASAVTASGSFTPAGATTICCAE